MNIKDLALEALTTKLNDIIDWQPDYEECGIQFGPSWDNITTIVSKILTLDPTYTIPDNEELLKHLRSSRNKKIKLMIERIEIKKLPKQWGDKLISEMSFDHLLNSLKYMERMAKTQKYKNIKEYKYYKAISLEIEKRDNK